MLRYAHHPRPWEANLCLTLFLSCKLVQASALALGVIMCTKWLAISHALLRVHAQEQYQQRMKAQVESSTTQDPRKLAYVALCAHRANGVRPGQLALGITHVH